MAQANNGDTVKVHYTGKLDGGTVFDSSADRDPLEFKLGEGIVISGFEKAVVGMEPGAEKTFKISSDDAYGPVREDLIATVGRDRFPGIENPQVNQTLKIKKPDGEEVIAAILDVTETEITLDTNHPLAGQDLTFDIQLVEIS